MADDKIGKKEALKQEIATGFDAPDIRDKVVRFVDVKAAFLKAARKEFGFVVEKVIAHKMSSMEKEGGLPESFPGSKFGENLIKAVDNGEVPEIGFNVMKEKVTPMLAEAVRTAPEQPAQAGVPVPKIKI
jgi:hypothetical protein